MIGDGWEKRAGGRLELITNAELMLQKAQVDIDARRAPLRLAPYDPSRWGASGDWRMRELEKLKK